MFMRFERYDFNEKKDLSYMFLKKRTWAIYISKYKGLELYDFNVKKDLSSLFMRIERTWTIGFNKIKNLSYMFL